MHHPNTISTPSHESKVSSIGVFMVSLGATLFFYEFFIRVIPSVIAEELRYEFSLTASMLGVISSSFYYAYTFMQIPSGLLCDRFGPKKLLTIGMICVGISTFLFASSTTVSFVALSRFICGATSAFAFICPAVLAINWIPGRHFALVAGLIQAMGCLGAIIGSLPLSHLVDIYGWRIALIFSGLPGIIIGIFIILFLKDRPDHIQEQFESQEINLKSQWEGLKRVILRPQNWLIGACGFCSWGPLAVFAELWGIQFVHYDLNITANAASMHLQFIWAGVALGGVFYGWLSSHLQSRKKPIIICFLIGIISTLHLTINSHIPAYFLDSDLFLIGTVAGVLPITFGLTKDQNSPDIIGTATAFHNMLIIMSGVILQPLFGLILDLYWTGHSSNGARVYTLFEYQNAMWILPICCTVGLFIIIFCIQETHCKQQKSNHLAR